MSSFDSLPFFSTPVTTRTTLSNPTPFLVSYEGLVVQSGTKTGGDRRDGTGHDVRLTNCPKVVDTVSPPVPTGRVGTKERKGSRYKETSTEFYQVLTLVLLRKNTYVFVCTYTHTWTTHTPDTTSVWNRTQVTVTVTSPSDPMHVNKSRNLTQLPKEELISSRVLRRDSNET